MLFDFLRRILPQRLFGPGGIRAYRARYGKGSAPTTPLLIYGHRSDYFAKLLSEHSTVNCLAVEGMENLATALEKSSFIGLMAMSPENAPGEAGKAIALFRARHPGTLTLYQAWSYNVDSAARWAKEYGAHGIVMPGMEANEMLNYLFEMGRRADAEEPIPATVEEYRQLLRQYAPKSPFWEVQEQPDRACY